MKLLYLAKPIYGGWVSFSANLAEINKTFIYKLGKKTEFTKDRNNTKVAKYRDFGYGIKYRNFSLQDFLNINDDILICAIDKKYHNYLEELPLEKTTIVIHDPTEIKSQKNYLSIYLNKFKKVITIRKLVENYLNNLNIPNNFLLHPYITRNYTFNSEKKGAICISRIDWDKHTEIVLEANYKLKNKIKVYGDKNDRYVYNKLKNLDSMLTTDNNSCYQGRYPKDYNFLANLLAPCKFMIDLSKIKNDGGGTQYTFLEAINHKCCLVLNKSWVDVPGSIWKHKENCLAVNNADDLIEILVNDLDVSNIVKNADKILENHKNYSSWVFNK